MTEHPNYDKLLIPVEEVAASVETLMDGAFGRLMGDQREVLKRIHASAWAFHTLVLEIVTNIGIENIAKRAYLPKKFDDYINPLEKDASNLLQGLDGPLSEEQQVAVEFIHVMGQLLRRYIDNLWLYSQLSNDLYHLDKQLVPIETLINPENWSVTNDPVELELFVPNHLPLLHVDVTLIQVAINQIVENAIQHTHKGLIRVHVESLGDMMKISVIDTGNGISADHHQDVFTPFFQINPDQTGLGLGLSIAQKCLLMHQGIVQVDSANTTTTILMKFPLH